MMSKRYWAAMAVAFWTVAAQAASLSVTDVKIAQRYPWNGLVDITYTVNCDDPNKDVWVYPVGYDADKATSVALMPEFLSGAGASNAVHNGTHQMTWDMAKQMGKNYNRAAFSVTLHAYCDAAPYMVIDLSAGSNAEQYPVSYLAEIPEGGWNDEYKTTKMVFRLILPGKTGNGATLTKPYYFGVFPITERQWCLVDGGSSSTSAWMRGVSYDMLRGTVLGSMWPQHQQVEATSFIGKMRLRTGITIDLPTSAQWYRAASAGGLQGVANPNVWGIYGIGEVAEWNLNWYGTLSGVDPSGPTSNGNNARAISGRYYPGASMTSSGPSFYPPYGSLSASEYARSLVYYSSGNFLWSYHYFKPSVERVSYGLINNGSYKTGEEGISARLVALPACK